MARSKPSSSRPRRPEPATPAPARPEPAVKPAPRDGLSFDLSAPPVDPPAWFEPRLGELGVSLDEGDTPKLARFLGLLRAANERVNLTAITEPEVAWERHVLDALSLIPLLAELPEGASVADVGSGGGVPALPLAITMPHLTFTLIEATSKKAAFLEAAIGALGLSNARVIADRAETLGADRHGLRERFDAVTARALGPLAVSAELTVPLASLEGRVLLVKGQKAEQEIEEAAGALEQLRAHVAGVFPTPTGRVVVLGKLARTPRTFPRAPGEPKRAPLG